MSRNKTIKVTVAAEDAVSLKDLAAKLAKWRGWSKWKVEGDQIVYATGDEPDVERVIETSGFAYVVQADGNMASDDENNVDWAEDFDAWSNYVWAKDEDGNAVMLHD